jgi:hypothetical protein
MLLSATPHQGNHFQFWMLAQLLNPTLFGSPEEMLEHRHRLNTVMFRRTKADACQPDGSPLFRAALGAHRVLPDGRRSACSTRSCASTWRTASTSRVARAARGARSAS